MTGWQNQISCNHPIRRRLYFRSNLNHRSVWVPCNFLRFRFVQSHSSTQKLQPSMDLKLPKWGKFPILNMYIYILQCNQPVFILFGAFWGFPSPVCQSNPHLHGSVVTPTVPPGPESGNARLRWMAGPITHQETWFSEISFLRNESPKSIQISG